MSKLTLTPDELEQAEQLECTPEEFLQLKARRAQRLSKARLAEYEADLPKLRARADLARDLEGRSINGVQRGAQLEVAAATPGAPDDVIIYRLDDGRDFVLNDEDGPRVRLPTRRTRHCVTRAQYDAVGAQGPLWERRIVFCVERHHDLRAEIKAGVNDPIHDTMGRKRYDWESENDPALIDAFVVAVLKTTTDRDLLEGWLEAAGDQQHGIAIRERFDALFGTSAPDFWGGKDDKKRFASPVGHYSVGTRG
jgi:hypothetical protein